MSSRAIALVVAVVAIVGSILVLENPFAMNVVDQGRGESAGPRPVGTNIGWQAPDFTLKTASGEDLSLSNFRGKVVVLNFWATWCPFCVNEMPAFQQLNEELEDDIVILGVNRAEGIQKQKDFLENELLVEITYLLLQDPTDSVAEAYGVAVMPTTFFLDEDGVIANRRLGEMTFREMMILARESSKEAKDMGGNPELVRELKEVQSGEVVMGARPAQGVRIMQTDGIKHTVPLDMIFSGGPSKDGIPSIDNPKFVSASEADSFLDDDDLVLGIVIDGIAKAYPRMIMVWHEIANDEINGVPIAITYCPLCYTGAAYVRMLGEEPVEFGVSGKLYNSDLVMYDRKTDTYWSQILGQGIVGELAGYELSRLPLDTLTWGDWKSIHPETQVLSTDTGFLRSYGNDPYVWYYSSPGLMFPVENRDDRLHTKALVYGVEFGGQAKAYPEDLIREVKIVNDEIGGVKILVLWHPEKNVVSIYHRTLQERTLEFELEGGKIVDKETRTEWSFDGTGVRGELSGESLDAVVAPAHFWFAWAAFKPGTMLFTP